MESNEFAAFGEFTLLHFYLKLLIVVCYGAVPRASYLLFGECCLVYNVSYLSGTSFPFLIAIEFWNLTSQKEKNGKCKVIWKLRDNKSRIRLLVMTGSQILTEITFSIMFWLFIEILELEAWLFQILGGLNCIWIPAPLCRLKSLFWVSGLTTEIPQPQWLCLHLGEPFWYVHSRAAPHHH